MSYEKKLTAKIGSIYCVFSKAEHSKNYESDQATFLQNYSYLFFPKTMLRIYEDLYEKNLAYYQQLLEYSINKRNKEINGDFLEFEFALKYFNGQIQNLKRSIELKLLPVKKSDLYQIFISAYPFLSDRINDFIEVFDNLDLEDLNDLIFRMIDTDENVSDLNFVITAMKNFELFVFDEIYNFRKNMVFKKAVNCNAFYSRVISSEIYKLLTSYYCDPTVFDIILRVSNNVYPGVTLNNISDEFIKNECKNRVLRVSYFSAQKLLLALPYKEYITPIEDIYQTCKKAAINEIQNYGHSIDRFYYSILQHRYLIYTIRVKKKLLKRALEIIMNEPDQAYKNFQENIELSKPYMFDIYNIPSIKSNESYRASFCEQAIENLYKNHSKKKSKETYFDLLKELFLSIHSIGIGNKKTFEFIKLLENIISKKKKYTNEEIDTLVDYFYNSGGRYKDINIYQSMYAFYDYNKIKDNKKLF